MTSFEFVFGLISVVTSLALTQLLGGMVTLYRCSDRLRLSWRHALWTATAFMLLIGNWSALWRLHDNTAWDVLDVLAPLVYTSVLYAFCDMVMPDRPDAGAVVDLRDYHVREGRRYKVLQLVFAILVIAALARFATSIGDWAQSSTFALFAAAIGIVALRSRSVWLDTATALALAALAAIFMVLRLHALAAAA